MLSWTAVKRCCIINKDFLNGEFKIQVCCWGNRLSFRLIILSVDFSFVVAISQLTGEFESFHNTQSLSQTTYKCKKCRYIFLVQCCQYLFYCQPQWISGWQIIVKLTHCVLNKEFVWCTSMIPVMIQNLALGLHVWNEQISAVFNSWLSQKRSGFS